MASSKETTSIDTTSENTSGTTRKRKNTKNYVTFSKRKSGLFNKVTELAILCQAEAALIITSQNGELYTCGYPTPDSVIRRFLAGESSASNHARPCEKEKQKKSVMETLRVQYEATQEILKEEKKRRDAMEANKGFLGFPSWWENSIDEMGLEELEQFKSSLEQLKINLMATMEEKRVNSIVQPIPFPSSVLPMGMYSNFSSVLYGGLCTDEQEQAWGWGNNGIAVSSNNSSLGTLGWSNNGIVSSSNSSLVPNVGFGHYCHN